MKWCWLYACLGQALFSSLSHLSPHSFSCCPDEEKGKTPGARATHSRTESGRAKLSSCSALKPHREEKSITVLTLFPGSTQPNNSLDGRRNWANQGPEMEWLSELSSVVLSWAFKKALWKRASYKLQLHFPEQWPLAELLEGTDSEGLRWQLDKHLCSIRNLTLQAQVQEIFAAITSLAFLLCKRESCV